jgi:hypothetical protein
MGKMVRKKPSRGVRHASHSRSTRKELSTAPGPSIVEPSKSARSTDDEWSATFAPSTLHKVPKRHLDTVDDPWTK